VAELRVTRSADYWSESTLDDSLIDVRSSRNIAQAAQPLYETDYYAWVQEQVRALRAGRPADLDVENVAEELEDLGKTIRRELQSRMELVLTHPSAQVGLSAGKRSPSWENTLVEQRGRVSDLLMKNPSLKNYLDEVATDAYRYARGAAGNDVGLAPREWRRHFPAKCPWSVNEILNPSFIPKSRVG
jgi:hypothetical protein